MCRCDAIESVWERTEPVCCVIFSRACGHPSLVFACAFRCRYSSQGNNPGPYQHPNGTVFIVFTEYDMGLFSAPSWQACCACRLCLLWAIPPLIPSLHCFCPQGPYTLVTSGACGGGEDPSLYIDPKGQFHCLYHRAPFSDPDVAIGHSFSRE